MGNWAGMRALIHARESVFEAKDGNRSTQEQVAESSAWCESEGIDVAAVIVEDGVSGAAKNRKKWERAKQLLIGGDERGPIDMLVSWSSSRAQRDLDEYVRLRRLCVDAEVLWCYGGRVYDMTDGDDRFRTAIDGAVAERDLSEIRKNVKRALRANAAAGRPHGRLLFGYRRVYDPETRAFIRQEPDPDTAPVVRRIFTDYLAGQSLKSIARDLNHEGVPSAQGSTWQPYMVGRTLDNRGYIGERTYWPKEARKRGEPPGEDSVVKDAWEPLVDPEVFERVQARRETRGREAKRHWRQTPKARLLTAVAYCGAEIDGAVCGEKLVINAPSKASHKYVCPKTHVGRTVQRLDAYVTAAILERLARDDADELLAGSEDPEVVAARKRAEELRAELDQARRLRRGEIPGRKLSLMAFAEEETRLLPLIEAAEREARRAALPIEVDVPPPEQLPAWWADELTAEQRREIAGALIVAVVVRPVGRSRLTYDMSDFTTIEWRR